MKTEILSGVITGIILTMLKVFLNIDLFGWFEIALISIGVINLSNIFKLKEENADLNLKLKDADNNEQTLINYKRIVEFLKRDVKNLQSLQENTIDKLSECRDKYETYEQHLIKIKSYDEKECCGNPDSCEKTEEPVKPKRVRKPKKS